MIINVGKFYYTIIVFATVILLTTDKNITIAKNVFENLISLFLTKSNV